ncbi:helicase [Gracilaria domingensis]|nr:helicase [Gracilaria domingensis]
MRAVMEKKRQSEEERTDTAGKVFFVQGHAGTGKTYLLSLLRDIVESQGLLVEMTATTGIAAALYSGGRTFHSLLGTGVDDDKNSQSRERRTLSKYGPRTQRAELLRKIVLLVIDEASVCPKLLLEVVDAILKDLRRPRKDSGGLIMVLAGDYMQLLPVIPRTRTITDENENARRIPVNILRELPWYDSELWDRNTEVLRLTEQVRQQNDLRFARLLLDIRKGRSSPMRTWNLIDSQDMKEVRLDPLIVALTNQLDDEHNQAALRIFPGRKYHLPSATTVEPMRSPHGDRIQTVLGPEVGVPVIVVRNVLHPHLVHGKMFVVTGVSRRCVRIAEMNSDRQLTQNHVLHRIDFKFEYIGIKVRRRQFSIRLAFAATVHKSQGQTLRKMVIDFRANFFAPGQVYAGLSRVRKNTQVLLLHNEDDTPIRTAEIHEMPVRVKNPGLPEAVDFVESRRYN